MQITFTFKSEHIADIQDAFNIDMTGTPAEQKAEFEGHIKRWVIDRIRSRKRVIASSADMGVPDEITE